MKKVKKILLLLLILGFGFSSLVVYMSDHYYFAARDRAASYEEKITVLQRAGRWDPFNSRVFQELGRSYYHLGLENLGVEEVRNSSLKNAISQLKRAIRLNPGAYQSHFYFAQAIYHLDFFIEQELDFFEEYKKAAMLTTDDRNVYLEVGKILLSQWTQLTEENKQFTLKLIKPILNRRERERIISVFQIWSNSGADFDVIDAILPRSPDVFRLYARFLGEKSLSLDERQVKLAQAEYMEYERAKSDYRNGQQNFRLYRLSKARGDFRATLRALENIFFYQDLIGLDLIDRDEFQVLKKSCYEALIRCDIESGQNFSDVRKYLCEYLKLESDSGEIAKIESYLIMKGFLERDTSPDIADRDKLRCKIAIDFTQHRYRDIIRVGERLKQDFIFFESKDRDFLDIYQIIGDSYQRTDFLYDADVFYQKALEIDPENLETLVRIYENYERLNDAVGMRETERRIQEVILPSSSSLKEMRVEKGEMVYIPAVLREEDIRVIITFSKLHSAPRSLIAAMFNGKVVVEGYFPDGMIETSVSPVRGANSFQILPVNGTITLERLEYEPDLPLESE